MDTQLETLTEIQAVLQHFQDGYLQRDPAQVDQFMRLFVADKSLEVIGTSASGVDRDEWCIGPAMARELFVGDWIYWGDLRLELAAAHIHTLGDVAWLSAPATVSQDSRRAEAFANYLEFVRGLLDQKGEAEHKVLRIQLGCANTLYELGRGEHFIWPLVLTAVLVRREGRWLFQQLRFGFPTTRYPDERILA